MSNAVELMLANPNMARMKARSIHVRETFIHHWLMPLQGTLAPLLEGYQVGLTTGDIESAAMSRKCLLKFIFICFLMHLC